MCNMCVFNLVSLTLLWEDFDFLSVGTKFDGEAFDFLLARHAREHKKDSFASTDSRSICSMAEHVSNRLIVTVNNVKVWDQRVRPRQN